MQQADGGGAGGAAEAAGSSSMQTLLALLADGEEQARKLGEMTTVVAAGDAEERYRGAARRLQCTLAKAAAVARAIDAAGSTTSRGTDDRSDDSPRSADESSGRTTTTAAAEAQDQRHQGSMCKRRKGLPRWTAKFRVPDATLEATPDDGFSWRKYGQKDILGAKFPRGYYRCTYRAAQSCPATKQVQRSDTDLCVFDVTYHGDHTCHQKQRATVTVPSTAAHGGTHSPPPPPPPPQDPSMQLLGMGFKHVLKVETAGLLHDRDYGPASAPAAATSFSFPSAVPAPFHHHAGESSAADFSTTDTNNPAAAAAADFSAAPASSYFSAAPHFDVVYDYDEARVRGGAESSELGEVVSRAITAAPAPAAAPSFDDYASLFQYHQAEVDPHLPFPPFGGPPHGPFQ